ncbi:MAG TPA: hypothetical protein VGS07_14645 [Thermoanaerobaculia bacterium]|jgi:hypothetical protein|nr:hypothetical protein [Thermoanaerobaculia bacterium]
MDTFEEKFKDAITRGQSNRRVIKLLRREWVEAVREKMVLHTFRQAHLFLGQVGYSAETDKANGTEVYFRWGGHELKFDFDKGTGKIICTSSLEDLNERYDMPTESNGFKGFDTFCVEDKLIAFGQLVAALIE